MEPAAIRRIGPGSQTKKAARKPPSRMSALSPSPGPSRERRRRRGTYFIVGIANSAPSLTPDGQRDVTVLVLV